MKIRSPKTERLKKCPAYIGPKLWNRLPENIHHITTKPLFKGQIEALIKQRASVDVHGPQGLELLYS